jgi:hypothetical protein
VDTLTICALLMVREMRVRSSNHLHLTHVVLHGYLAFRLGLALSDSYVFKFAESANFDMIFEKCFVFLWAATMGLWVDANNVGIVKIDLSLIGVKILWLKITSLVRIQISNIGGMTR